MVQVPEFVNLSGKKVRFTDLPIGTQQALVKGFQSQDQAITNVIEKGTGTPQELSILSDRVISSNLSDQQKSQAINSILSDRSLSPREKIRIRERALNKGIKGTNLFLGTASPEVLRQLQLSSEQENFGSGGAREQQIDLIKSGRFSGFANTSNVPLSVSRARAENIFKKQQSTTLATSRNVREVLDSPEFQQIKAEGGTSEDLNKLLNDSGVQFPKSTQLIVNELAQTDIQGEAQTAINIEQILRNSGIITDVSVTSDNSPLGASFTTSEASNPVVQSISNTISGVTPSDLGGITSISTGGGFGSENAPFTIPEEGGNILSDIGKVVNDLLGFNINPLILGALVVFAPIAVILLIGVAL